MVTETRTALLNTVRPTLKQALVEFGLAEAFRTQPQHEQLRQLQWVAGTASATEQHERIAEVLDELASHSFDYCRKRTA